jgi:peptide/nickel transport system ATP-binding protein
LPARLEGRCIVSRNGNGPAVIDVRGLRIEIETGAQPGADIVAGVDFEISEAEVLALVGESGCGKTATALACLGYARRGTRISGGEIFFDGLDLLRQSDRALQRVRGVAASYVPQDPATALHPSLSIGEQLDELLRVHHIAAGNRRQQVCGLLEEVQLPSDERFLRRYPHQLSGGQQQRVVIALALACRPRLVVLDEPTTGLDVTTQARILETISELRRDHRLAMLYVTHDLGVVAQIADRVAVMYAGRIVEMAPKNQIFERPRHPYTRRLLAAVPSSLAERRRLRGIPGSAVAPEERPFGCPFAPRCDFAREECTRVDPPAEPVAAGHSVRCIRWREIDAPIVIDEETVDVAREWAEPALLAIRDLVATYPERASFRQMALRAIDGISFVQHSHEALAVVGESGSGKSTLARCIVGLHAPASGRIDFHGTELAARAADREIPLRRQIQIVFQNPDDSLNPKRSIGEILERPLKTLAGVRGAELRARVDELLEVVRLPKSMVVRYPRELSGGERQRVAIARALAPGPELLIADEITSALDVSVQAAIIELLLNLKKTVGVALLFVSHDLAVVRSIADRVVVVQNGRIREAGDAEDIFNRARDSYTRELLAAVPDVAQAYEPTPVGAQREESR